MSASRCDCYPPTLVFELMPKQSNLEGRNMPSDEDLSQNRPKPAREANPKPRWSGATGFGCGGDLPEPSEVARAQDLMIHATKLKAQNKATVKCATCILMKA